MVLVWVGSVEKGTRVWEGYATLTCGQVMHSLMEKRCLFAGIQVQQVFHAATNWTGIAGTTVVPTTGLPGGAPDTQASPDCGREVLLQWPTGTSFLSQYVWEDAQVQWIPALLVCFIVINIITYWNGAWNKVWPLSLGNLSHSLSLLISVFFLGSRVFCPLKKRERILYSWWMILLKHFVLPSHYFVLRVKPFTYLHKSNIQFWQC